MSLRKVKLALLVEDVDLYPRLQVNDVDVRELVDALEAGAVVPPIVADKRTNIIIDGWKRRRAYMRLFGEESSAEVEFRTYKSKAEMLLDAIRLNSSHGQKLCRGDIARCICLAEELKMDRKDLAAALHLTPARLDQICLRKTAFDSDGRLTPIKYTLQHFAGRSLTDKQLDGNRRAGGVSARFMVEQVINLLESDLIDRDNSVLMGRLVRLYELLKSYIQEFAVAAS